MESDGIMITLEMLLEIMYYIVVLELVFGIYIVNKWIEYYIQQKKAQQPIDYNPSSPPNQNDETKRGICNVTN